MWEMIHNRRLIFGEGKISQIPEILEWYGKKKVFLAVYSKEAPVCRRMEELLESKGISCFLYDAVTTEPDLHMINTGRDLFLENKCDCSLAIGGGSVIDVTKAIGMLAVNGGNVEEYQMEGRQVTAVMPFFIAVPTTSGTGAEATKVSVVKNNYNGLKKSLYHTTMIADVVILDPELTVGLNQKITSATGMDALSHAIESYVSRDATPVTQMYGLKAIELIRDSLRRVCENPADVKARGDMMLASYFGGVAITAGIGIAHIMAQPVGAMYQIPHGDACSIFLPHAMRMNMEAAAPKYARIARAAGVYTEGRSERENGMAAVEWVEGLQTAINAPDHLSPYMNGEMPKRPELIDIIMRTTGHITCNPEKVDEDFMYDIFRRAI